MILLLTLVITLIFLLFVKYVLPTLIRYSKLKKDYEGIALLPLSSIPLLGHIPHFDYRPHAFYQFLCRLARQAQETDKRTFCIWYSIWPAVFLCSSKGLETFLNNTKQLAKSFDYTFLEPWLKTGLLTSKNEKWRSRRRLLTPSFHDTQLLHSFMHIFNEQSVILARRCEKFAKQPTQPHDLYSYFSACTLDVITEAATGTNARAQAGDETNDVVRATIQATEIAFLRVRSPWLWPKFIFERSKTGREQQKALKILHAFSRNIIEERLATFTMDESTSGDDKKNRRRLVFLDNLLTQMKQENLTLDDIQEEVDTFMFEGHDTTATAVTFASYFIASHPDVQAKIQAELYSIFGDDQERECTIEDAQKMNYLECCIKESLRLCPSVPVVARELQEDYVYNDQIIRKGTTVALFIYAIGRDPNVYTNPDKFDPERFADNSVASERSPYAHIPFSAGSRNCIGQRFALLEEKVILSTLFRRFSFECNQKFDELEVSIPLVMRYEKPMKIFIKNRS